MLCLSGFKLYSRWVPPAMVTQLTVGNVSVKYARLMFAEKSFSPPLTESYSREQTFTPSAVHELPLIQNRH